MQTDNRRVYFDNAATTQIDNRVFDAMEPILREYYGNPSSIHAHGRKAKNALEQSRKSIANLLNVSPSEIIFTSGGTEADNMALRMSVKCLGVKHIISSPIEHHAVLNTLEELFEEGKISLELLSLDSKGKISLTELEEKLKANPNTMVSLMHGNNEIGNVNDLEAIGNLCKTYNAYFHTDTVQTMGHYPLNLGTLPVDFAVGSAHKFNGPKGVGFLYASKECKIRPYLTGGGQERGMRAGTENIVGIVGMAKALELSIEEIESKRQKVEFIKQSLKEALQEDIEGIEFNGDTENNLYTVLSVSFPAVMASDLFLFQLDLHGISASGGSACSSGSSQGSHVIRAIGGDTSRNHIRFSFGKFNQLDDVLFLREQLKKIFSSQVRS